MEKAEIPKGCSLMGVDQAKDEVEEMISNLPIERKWINGYPLCLFQSFWCTPNIIRGIVCFQTHFQAHDSDVILATAPKSGTTWSSALIFTIVNRTRFTLQESPLLTANPHELVRSLECDLYSKYQSPNLEGYPQPRIFYTHTPYTMLPPSIKISNCKVVYVCRNPLDMFISLWHFYSKAPPYENVEQLPMEDVFEMFCKGVHNLGPFWNHILGYWKASLERPEKFLILKYEDLKEDNILCIKRLAEFLGFPFSAEEEKLGVIEEISRLCSFKNLKELEVNKNGKHRHGFSFSNYFRKGEVGDWGNYLSPSVVERMEKLIQEKFKGSGVTFNLPPSIQKD